VTSAIHPALRRKGWDITADGKFYMPTRVLFGRGIAGQIAGHVTALGADAVLLVTDPGVRAAGLITPVEAALAAAGIAVALGADHPGVTRTQLAQAAIAAIRDLNADLGVPPMRDLIKPEDLDVLAAKAEANTSTPSNPRTATAADYRAMFARELGSERTQHEAGGSRTMENRRL
jgi:alcohol dehydrogenase class IV